MNIIIEKESLMIDMDDVLVTNYFIKPLNDFLNNDYKESDFKNFYMQEKIPEHRRVEFFDYFLKYDIYRNAIISETLLK